MGDLILKNLNHQTNAIKSNIIMCQLRKYTLKKS